MPIKCKNLSSFGFEFSHEILDVESHPPILTH